MEFDNVSQENLCHYRCHKDGVNRGKVGNLGQSFHHHHGGNMTMRRHQKKNNEIHGDNVPLPLRYLMWLQEPN